MASPNQQQPQGLNLNPEQIQQMIAMEAQKRGMTIQQFQDFQRKQIEEAAAQAGMSIQEFVQMKQEEARQTLLKQQQQQQAAQGQQPGNQQQQGQPGSQVQQISIHNPPEPKPEALAVAKFLRSQDLKLRTVIFEGQRRDMFKVKRAFRALHSDKYKKARAKNPLLPPVENDEQARSTVQLLPLSVLALRVVKTDPHAGHDHPKKKEKRVKGRWDVEVHPQQDFDPMMHYMWLYEGPQWKQKLWAVLAVILVFTVVMFPLWPLKMRQGVWYLSVGAMFLLGAFFAMALFRLVLFCITVFAVPPGLWLFPNLFEDVGFVDSFKPLWGWQENKKKKTKKSKAIAPGGTDVAGKAESSIPNGNGNAVSSAAQPVSATAVPTKRHAAPTVEEAEDE